MRRAAAVALAVLALAGAPAVRGFAPDLLAQEKKDKDSEKDKEAERKRKEEEERKKREKALKKAVTDLVTGFAAKDVNAVLRNVAEGATVRLKLGEATKASDNSRQQAKGVLESFFGGWKVIRVDTSAMSVDENVASLPLELYKDSAEGKRFGKRLRVTVGTAEDRHPLVKLVVEW